MDRSLIEQYAAGGAVPAELIRGLSAAHLDAHPEPGRWSIREVVVHLMDSDLVGADRMKRVIAEDRPSLPAYDQDAFAARLGYGHVDAAAAAELFALNRRLMAAVLRRLPDDAFRRAGVHSENGPMTLEQLVGVYVGHVEHHARFARRKRELLGK
ncbi:MAG: DinB family protein [Gemmataceae bacterium]|nr:DinB family protein [Gemmataceae bacterium]